jgi:hypothetical protein
VIAVLEPPPLVMPLVALLGPFLVVVVTLLLHRAEAESDADDEDPVAG